MTQSLPAKTRTADRWNWLLPVAIGLVCMGLIALLQWTQLQQLQASSQTASVESLRQADDAERARLQILQKAPAFGFDNAIASWTFLNFLQYFGDQPARSKTDFSLSPEYFRVILARDPFFLPAYTFLSTSTAIYAGLPDQAVAIAQQGLKSLRPGVPPGAHFVWRQLGIDQLLFLGDAAAAQQSFATAAQWALQSSLPGSDRVAISSQQTADFLANNPNSKFAQVSAWTMVLSSAPDDRTQQLAEQRIVALGGQIIRNPDGTVQIQSPAED